MSLEDQLKFAQLVRSFIRFYEFLLQVSCFEDTELHKKYHFIVGLNAYLDVKRSGGGYNLDGKIQASDFVQKKEKEIKGKKVTSDPILKLPTAEAFGLTEDKIQKLSEIIVEINNKTGRFYDSDVAVKCSEENFEFSYYDDIDDALIEGLEQNKDFFSLLLKNPEIKKEVLGIFSSEIYQILRAAK